MATWTRYPRSLGPPMVQGLRAKHSELTARLSDMQTIYGEKHPQIVSTRAEIAGIERRLRGEISNILAGLRNELESAEMNEAALRQELATVRQEMFQLDQAETTIGQVAQRLQANQDLYQNLLKRYTEAVALRENQQPDARIISPAQTPLKPFPSELPSDTRPFLRGLGRLGRLPAGHRRASPPKARTPSRTSSAMSGCRSSG